MTYAAEEISVQGGAPVELYTFAHGSSVWRYTSRESNYTDDSGSPTETFTAAAISRTAIESTHEKARNAIRLTVPRNFAIAELFRVAPPSDVISVTVRRVHRGDAASPIVAWVGRVLNATFEGPKATLTCEPVTVSLQRTGLRRIYSLGCPHVLYGEGCNLDKASFAHATTVASVSGITLTVASVGAYNYSGGFVEWTNGDGNVERRFIESHTAGSPSSTTLTLMSAFAGIAVSDAVTLYPGCDHSLATCDATFSNAVNYGGFPFIPKLNPFKGDPVF